MFSPATETGRRIKKYLPFDFRRADQRLSAFRPAKAYAAGICVVGRAIIESFAFPLEEAAIVPLVEKLRHEVCCLVFCCRSSVNIRHRGYASFGSTPFLRDIAKGQSA